MHKQHKEYIFVPTHAASHATKVIRIGVFLDYERGVLSFYNASTAVEKRHLYTFRTFFNRPVWPLLSLRQGKLQVLTGLPVPRNLVWKTRWPRDVTVAETYTMAGFQNIQSRQNFERTMIW